MSAAKLPQERSKSDYLQWLFLAAQQFSLSDRVMLVFYFFCTAAVHVRLFWLCRRNERHGTKPRKQWIRLNGREQSSWNVKCRCIGNISDKNSPGDISWVHRHTSDENLLERAVKTWRVSILLLLSMKLSSFWVKTKTIDWRFGRQHGQKRLHDDRWFS